MVERGEFHLRLLQCRLLAGELGLQLLLFLDRPAVTAASAASLACSAATVAACCLATASRAAASAFERATVAAFTLPIALIWWSLSYCCERVLLQQRVRVGGGQQRSGHAADRAVHVGRLRERGELLLGCVDPLLGGDDSAGRLGRVDLGLLELGQRERQLLLGHLARRLELAQLRLDRGDAGAEPADLGRDGCLVRRRTVELAVGGVARRGEPGLGGGVAPATRPGTTRSARTRRAQAARTQCVRGRCAGGGG